MDDVPRIRLYSIHSLSFALNTGSTIAQYFCLLRFINYDDKLDTPSIAIYSCESRE